MERVLARNLLFKWLHNAIVPKCNIRRPVYNIEWEARQVYNSMLWVVKNVVLPKMVQQLIENIRTLDSC